MSTEHLRELLQASRDYAPEYGSGLSSHLPMALGALERLGASSKRLSEFNQHYAARLEPLKPGSSTPVEAEKFRGSLGAREHYDGYRRFFRKTMAKAGLDECLERYVPVLMEGASAAAFHPLIQLAYAVESKLEPMVVNALAYWSDAFLPLGSSPATEARSDSVTDLLNQIANTEAFRALSFSPGLIFERFRVVAASPEFRGAEHWLRVTPTTEEQIASAALCLYACTNDFTALHTVTATHALRILRPHWSHERGATLGWYSQALFAAYISIGATELGDDELQSAQVLDDLPPWSAITQAAVGSDDEHVIKLVHSAHEEHKVRPNPLYRYCTARACQLA